MTQALATILDKVEQLSIKERAELADLILDGIARDVPPEIAESHIGVVRRRMAEVDAGEVAIIPGDQALEQIRKFVTSARKAR